ncbi:antibiotic biosynthesis monooxygenase family protein [Alteribacillus bidgolensis]|uniref:Antibiotic biosynthesis monooxygenase n=1 Tax=Alteribacillus bidgolensis TaxID=930129 RepID=A0A1G8RCS9_9BACI|nr:antibiotic biosynthesis monooxygenase family protein [Alteribacillus bidgolensis]SDJ14802.1 Antibiotic biosynthesis monooxygenase [Alteribacillus bidgolensis]
MNNKPIVWINVFTAKPGKLDELVAIQSEELLNFKNKSVPGWISSRWHRSVDNNKAIMVTTWESIESHKSWLERSRFTEHLNKIQHLIEGTEGGYYTLVENIENL